jgi:hypothetical protein
MCCAPTWLICRARTQHHDTNRVKYQQGPGATSWLWPLAQMWLGLLSARHVVASFHIHIAMPHDLACVSAKTWPLAMSATVAGVRVDHGNGFCDGIVHNDSHVISMTWHARQQEKGRGQHSQPAGQTVFQEQNDTAHRQTKSVRGIQQQTYAS